MRQTYRQTSDHYIDPAPRAVWVASVKCRHWGVQTMAVIPRRSASGIIPVSNSSMHHYECIALCNDISLQSSRFCTRINGQRKRSRNWLIQVHVVNGHLDAGGSAQMCCVLLLALHACCLRATVNDRRLNWPEAIVENFCSVISHSVFAWKICAKYAPCRVAYSCCVLSVQLLETFIEEYYDQNPISQLGLVTICNKRSEKVSELSGRRPFWMLL